MDAFKLLSRSTKLSKSSKKAAAPPTLPSGGQLNTPQLFYDKEAHLAGNLLETNPEQPGRKRKRVLSHREPIALSGELDFFAQRNVDQGSSKSQKDERNAESFGKTHENEGEVVSESAVDTFDEAKCRRILRGHKLKIMLLCQPAETKPDHESPKKGRSATKGKIQSLRNVDSAEDNLHNAFLYPRPLMNFKELRTTFGLSKTLVKNIQDQGFSIPTEVQMGSLPILLEDTIDNLLPKSLKKRLKGLAVDLLAVAPTGSGKTLAFLIPTINGLLQLRKTKSTADLSSGSRALVVAPTKELAHQIVNEGRKLVLGTGIKITGMRRGMRLVTELNNDELARPDTDDNDFSDTCTPPPSEHNTYLVKADIVVTTPMLFLNSLSDGSTGDVLSLPMIRFLVLDEADVLLDPLFKDQTLGIWKACTNPDLRVSLWSATMSSSIESLAQAIIHSRRQELSVHGPVSPSVTIRLVVGLKDSAIPNISHRLTYTATEHGKLIALRQLLRPSTAVRDSGPILRPPFLIFTQTIPRAIALHSEILYDIPPEAGGSNRIAVLHSDLSDTSRDSIMTRFRKGEIWILITTDLLSRGVDFRGINGVVNYDIPNSAASYVHRVGRTGRAGRDGGVAVTLYTKEDIPHVKTVANIIAISEKQSEKSGDTTLQKWLLDSLPQPSKNAKKMLKLHGVEARSAVGKGKREGKAVRAMRISTKSGFQRRLDNKRKGTIGGKGQKAEGYSMELGSDAETSGTESEWVGFD